MSIVIRTTKGGERRYDVRVRTPDGKVHNRTFRTRREAESYERVQLSARDRGVWTDPGAGRITLAAYAGGWLNGRTVRGRPLGPRTVESYRYLLERYVLPTFGTVSLLKVSPESVRSWHAALVRNGPESVAPKAYRLVHAIMATAEDDGLIGANPCRIKGAGAEHSPERPVIGPDHIAALADAVGPRWRALVLVAAYGGLRFGELVGLRRRDIDLRSGVVTVRSQLVEIQNGSRTRKDPKSEAGKRKVTLPAFVVEELRTHLVARVPSDLDAPVFTGSRGGIPLRRNWARIWSKARKDAGLPDDVHLHDLRHAGATLAAQLGATTKEVMARMGHSSTRAAMIYQHAADDRDRALAQALDEVGRRAANRTLTPPRDGRAMEG